MNITFNTFLGEPLAPVAVAYGAKTLSGKGGLAVPDGASSIVSTGGTNLQISGGYVVPASDGVTSGTVTFDNAATWTVTAEANAYSVRDIDELLAAANLTGLALGDTIRMRAGDYNSARAIKAIRRSAAPTGTWNGSNYAVIKPDDGAAVTMYWVIFKNDLGGTKYLSIEGIHGDTDGRGTYQGGVIEYEAGPEYCRIKDCTFGTANHSPTAVSGATLGTAIKSPVSGSVASNCTVENVSIDGAWTGISFSGPNNTFRNVTVRNAYSDSFTMITPINGLTMIGCTSTDKPAGYTPYSIIDITPGNPTLVEIGDASGIIAGEDCRIVGVVGTGLMNDGIYNINSVSGNVLSVGVNTTGGTYTGGGELQHSGTHADHIQLLGTGGSAGGMDDMTFRAITLTRGNGTPGWPDAQGFFGSLPGHAINNMTVEGMIVACSLANAFWVDGLVNADIASVAVVTVPGSWTGQPVPKLYMPNANYQGSNNTIRHSLAHGLQDNMQGTISVNNDFTIGSDIAALQAAFDNPQGASETTVTWSDYATKAGSAGDTASPKRGATPYCEFVSPWDYSDPGN